MRINFWMDYASPFCYIAFHRLNEAIKTVGIDQNKLEYNFCTVLELLVLLSLVEAELVEQPLAPTKLSTTALISNIFFICIIPLFFYSYPTIKFTLSAQFNLA